MAIYLIKSPVYAIKATIYLIKSPVYSVKVAIYIIKADIQTFPQWASILKALVNFCIELIESSLDCLHAQAEISDSGSDGIDRCQDLFKCMVATHNQIT